MFGKEDLLTILSAQSANLSRPLCVLDVGLGGGRYGEFLSSRPDLVSDIDGVDLKALNLTPNIDRWYRKVWTRDIRLLWDELPEYDIVIMDQINHSMDKSDLLCVLMRAAYAGQVVIDLGHNSETTRSSIISALGASEEGRYLIIPRRTQKAATLIVRTYERHHMTRASIDSLLDSWLPPCNILLLDDHSTDPRNMEYLEALDTSPHEKILIRNEKKHETTFQTVQKALDIVFNLPTEAEFIGFCDSDFIYNKKWFQLGQGSYEFALRDFPDLQAGAWTSFHMGPNAPWHKYKETRQTPFGKISIRRSSGWGNIIVDYGVASNIRRVDKRKDAGYADDIVSQGKCIIGTVPSYVQHVGAKTSTLGHAVGDWAPDFIPD